MCFKCFDKHSPYQCKVFVPCMKCGNTGHNSLICTMSRESKPNLFSAQQATNAHNGQTRRTQNDRMIHTTGMGINEVCDCDNNCEMKEFNSNVRTEHHSAALDSANPAPSFANYDHSASA